jgi:hypothetical protein
MIARPVRSAHHPVRLNARHCTRRRHPMLGVPYTKIAFRPMRELITLLEAGGFEVYICSAGGRDFVRVVAQEIYGIPPQRMIGPGATRDFLPWAVRICHRTLAKDSEDVLQGPASRSRLPRRMSTTMPAADAPLSRQTGRAGRQVALGQPPASRRADRLAVHGAHRAGAPPRHVGGPARPQLPRHGPVDGRHDHRPGRTRADRAVSRPGRPQAAGRRPDVRGPGTA